MPAQRTVAEKAQTTMARLLETYKGEFVPKLMERFGHDNKHAVPRLDKITVSMGIGKAIENNKRIEAAAKELAAITGQRPVITRSRKSVAGFKVRQGMPVGAKVTLRGRRMYEFLDRLISVAIPRIRDFRGFPVEAFDGHGNYSLGLDEQMVFPEIVVDDVEFVQGMNITMTFDRSNDEQSKTLLEMFGFPFRR